jgi:TolB protein
MSMKTLTLIPLVLALAAGGAIAAEQPPAELVYTVGSGKGARAYLTVEDGTEKRRLTNSRYSESQLVYSPDRKRIAFSSIRGSKQHVYVMNSDGTGVRRVTRYAAPAFQPAWSPDGRRIAFVSLRPNFEIYVINVDGSGERLLTPGPKWVGDSAPSWSPDGRWIAFSSSRLKDGNPEIFKMRPDGTKVTRLTFTDTPGEVSPDDGFPNWSPDGRSIVFSSNRADNQHDLWIMRADGKNLRRITKTPGFDDWTAKWSPDGQQIAFWGVGPGVNHIYTVNVDGSELRQVTRGASPEWRR